jgi:hypothetical protein
MQRLFRLWPAGLLALAVPAAAADLSVRFIEPEHYLDAGYSHPYASAKDRAEVQRDIERHLQQLAERGLPAGEALSIEVLDIDLAGWFEPFTFRSGAQVRVMRETTWPRIKLRYTLTRGDQALASVEEQVSDLNYLNESNRYFTGDRLRYEKAMLDAWFATRFQQH